MSENSVGKSGLAAAMNAVMRHCGYVQKDARMQGQGNYRYATEGAFIAAIRPPMVEAGVTVAPVSVEILADEPAAEGRKMRRMLARVTFRFSHAATGETLDVTTLGEGQDVGDKCANKCMTAALKYALRQAFLIETGDDPDDGPAQPDPTRQQPKSPPVIPPDPRRQALSAAIKAAGWEWAAAMRWLAGAYPQEAVKYTEKTRFADIEPARADHLVRHLNTVAEGK